MSAIHLIKLLYTAMPFHWAKKSLFRKTSRWYKTKEVGIVRSNNGQLQFDITIGDPVETSIYLNGIFEPATCDKISNKINEVDNFYDIGCNMGYFTCFAGISNTNAHIISIDANPEMTRKTSDNCQLNNIKADIFNHGVGSKAGEMLFFVNADRPSFGSFGNDGKPGENYTISVKILTISEIIDKNDLPNPEFLKIDIEGFEPEFFKGLSDKHFSSLKYMIIEHIPSHMEKCGISPNELWENERMKVFNYFSFDEKGSFRKINYADLNEYSGMLYAEKVVFS